jgi:hypothetical protein
MGKCYVCQFDQGSNVLFGDWLETSKIGVHHFCLLSFDALPQSSLNDGRLQGYLLKEIQEYSSKIRDNKCYLCGELSAAVSKILVF